MAFQRKKPAAIGVKAHIPGFVPPALAAPIDKVPSGDRWIHEIEFDGYRVQVHIANVAIKIYTRVVTTETSGSGAAVCVQCRIRLQHPVTVKAFSRETFGAFTEFERSRSPVVLARSMAALSVTVAATVWY